MDALALILPERMVDGDLILVAPRLEDAERHRLADDEERLRRFGWRRPETAAEARASFEQWIEAWRSGAPTRAYLAWRDGELVGSVELRRMSEVHAELSWWTYAAHRGLGLGTRAARLLCDAAAGVEGLLELRAHIDPDNAASRRLAERLGFVQAGTVDDIAYDGEVTTRLLYARSA